MASKHARVGFFLWVLTASLLYAQPSEKVQLVSSNLPILRIDTRGREILDTPRITAHLGIIYNGADKLNRIDDAANEYDGSIDIERVVRETHEIVAAGAEEVDVVMPYRQLDAAPALLARLPCKPRHTLAQAAPRHHLANPQRACRATSAAYAKGCVCVRAR